jgi:hypothetical protein
MLTIKINTYISGLWWFQASARHVEHSRNGRQRMRLPVEPVGGFTVRLVTPDGLFHKMFTPQQDIRVGSVSV